jgi:hypothetical protein
VIKEIMPVTGMNQFYSLVTELYDPLNYGGNSKVKDVLQFICSIEASQNPLRIEQFELKGQETSNNIEVSMLVTKVVAEAKQ